MSALNTVLNLSWHSSNAAPFSSEIWSSMGRSLVARTGGDASFWEAATYGSLWESEASTHSHNPETGGEGGRR